MRDLDHELVVDVEIATHEVLIDAIGHACPHGHPGTIELRGHRGPRAPGRWQRLIHSLPHRATTATTGHGTTAGLTWHLDQPEP